MFKKLLKYDMAAVARLWWIGAIISVAAAVAGALLLRFSVQVMDRETASVFVKLLAIVGLIAGIACLFAVVFSFVFTVILVFVRFYKHFFTDEGYLTFTLPVKRSTLFLSKTVNALIWFSAHFCVILISFLLFSMLVVSPSEGDLFLNFFVLKAIGKLLGGGWGVFGAWMIVYILEALVLLLVYAFFTISLVHFCITFGAVVAKKAKVILAIVMYYLINSAITTVSQFVILIFGTMMWEGMTILTQNASMGRMCGIYALLVVVLIGILSVLGTALYAVTQFMLDRKLNLA